MPFLFGGVADLLAAAEDAEAGGAEREHLDAQRLLDVGVHLLADRPVEDLLHVVVAAEQERHRHEAELRLPVAERAEVRPAQVERPELQRLGGGAEVEELRGRLDVDRHLALRALLDVGIELLADALDQVRGRHVVRHHELDGLRLGGAVDHRRGDHAGRGCGHGAAERAAREHGHWRSPFGVLEGCILGGRRPPLPTGNRPGRAMARVVGPARRD